MFLAKTRGLICNVQEWLTGGLSQHRTKGRKPGRYYQLTINISPKVLHQGRPKVPETWVLRSKQEYVAAEVFNL